MAFAQGWRRVNAIDPGVVAQTDGLALHAELPPPLLAVVASLAVLIRQCLAALRRRRGLELGCEVRAPRKRRLESARCSAEGRCTLAVELRLDGGEGALGTARPHRRQG
jgi:hypothetical protein